MLARVEKLTTKLVPDSITTILRSGDNPVVGRRPVHAKDDSIMGLPLDRFGVGSQGLDDQELVDGRDIDRIERYRIVIKTLSIAYKTLVESGDQDNA